MNPRPVLQSGLTFHTLPWGKHWQFSKVVSLSILISEEKGIRDVYNYAITCCSDPLNVRHIWPLYCVSNGAYLQHYRWGAHLKGDLGQSVSDLQVPFRQIWTYNDCRGFKQVPSWGRAFNYMARTPSHEKCFPWLIRKGSLTWTINPYNFIGDSFSHRGWPVSTMMLKNSFIQEEFHVSRSEHQQYGPGSFILYHLRLRVIPGRRVYASPIHLSSFLWLLEDVEFMALSSWPRATGACEDLSQDHYASRFLAIESYSSFGFQLLGWR